MNAPPAAIVGDIEMTWDVCDRCSHCQDGDCMRPGLYRFRAQHNDVRGHLVCLDYAPKGGDQ